MKETWSRENQSLVSQGNFGFNLVAVEAATKICGAIETDIIAYEKQIQTVVAVAVEPETENYPDIERINAKKNKFLFKTWNYLLELIEARKS